MCRAVDSGWHTRPQVSVRGKSSSRRTGPSGTAGTGSPAPAPTSMPARPSVTATWRPSCIASRPQVRPGRPPLQGHWGASSRQGLERSPRLWSASWWLRSGGGLGSHTQSSPLLPEEPGWPQVPRCGPARGLGSRHTALGFAKGSTVPGAAAVPSRMEMLPHVALGQDHPLARQLSRKTCRPQCASVSEPQRVPNGSPTALLLGPRHCEHFRDRMRTTQRQPAGVSIGHLTGRIDSGCLVSGAQGVSLVLAWGQTSRGVIMGFQQPDRRDGGCGAWSASRRCSAGESVSVCPRGGPGCRDHWRGIKWASVGRPPLLPGPPAFLTAHGQLQAL